MKKVILTRVASNDFVFLPSDNFVCAQQISATKGYLSFAPTINADVVEDEYLHTSGSAGGANMVSTNLAINLDS